MARAEPPPGDATRPVASGLLLVDKPSGITSHEAVMRVRKSLGVRRVGHTGTLDPFATGLLLVLAGPPTRLAEYFHALDKTYDATLELGRETTTHDREGETMSTGAWEDIDRSRLEAAFAEQVGELLQTPPRFSAKQVGGRRAHELARRGAAVDLAPVPVHVHEIDVTSVEPPRVSFRARVSTGTYIRCIARDVGRRLEAGAHLVALRRTAIGPFEVGDASPPEAAAAGDLRPASEAVAWMPRRELSEAEVRDVLHGRRVPRGPAGTAVRSGEPEEGEGPVALVADGRLIAVAEPVGDVLQPRKVLAA